MSFNECLPQFIFTIHRKRVCKCNCANVRIFQRYRTQTWRSLASRDSLTSWHFVRHRQSFLTNEYVWVRPEKACVIFPSFYHTDAGRHSGGIRSTLCRDRQTGSANKMECWCISLISGNIQIPLSIATVCAPLWGGGGQNLWLDFSASGHCWQFNETSWPTGFYHNSNPLSHSLKVARLLLVPAWPVGSLTCSVGENIFEIDMCILLACNFHFICIL